MAQVAIEHDLLVVCDETYEYFMYGEQRHVTLATFPGMWERTLTSYTFTKAYAMSGWRLGCIVGPKQHYTDRCRGTINVPHRESTGGRVLGR